jgi:hypothetical protein
LSVDFVVSTGFCAPIGSEYETIAIVRHKHIECKRRVMPRFVNPIRVTLM